MSKPSRCVVEGTRSASSRSQILVYQFRDEDQQKKGHSEHTPCTRADICNPQAWLFERDTRVQQVPFQNLFDKAVLKIESMKGSGKQQSDNSSAKAGYFAKSFDRSSVFETQLKGRWPPCSRKTATSNRVL